MPTIKITTNGAVTLPANFRRALGLNAGDFVNAEMKEGQVVLKPAKIIDADDAWFHTPEWQRGEAAVDQEIARGEVFGPFDNVDDALHALKNTKI